MDRRPNPRGNRGRIASGRNPASQTPLVVFGADLVAWWRADLGGLANPVSTWPDQSGNGFDLTQGVAGQRPALVAAGGPNGRPSVLFDGTDDRLLNAALDRPAPATTPTVLIGVFRQVTWVANDRGWGFNAAAANNMVLFEPGTEPAVGINNVTATLSDLTNFTTNVYKVVRAGFTGSTSDFLKVGNATTVTGTNTGVTDPGAGFSMGTAGNGTSPGNFEFAELFILRTVPSAAQDATINAYLTALYGSGIF